MRTAKRSGEAAIENKHHIFFAPVSGQLVRLTGIIRQGEVG
jgi:hypothetical protein